MNYWVFNLGMRAWVKQGIGEREKGKGERLNLFLFPFPFNLFPMPNAPCPISAVLKIFRI